LANLALVFYRRGGTYRDLGGFLKALFGEVTAQGVARLRLQSIECRHNRGAHYKALQECTDRSPFLDDHYHRPCLAVGSWEKGKNPGLVADDICKQAERFLDGMGKAVIEGILADHRWEPGRSSEDEYSQQSLPPWEKEDEDISRHPTPKKPRFLKQDRLASRAASVSLSDALRGDSPDTTYSGDSLFDHEDIREMLGHNPLVEEDEMGEEELGSQDTVDCPSEVESDANINVTAQRSSTKIRAATLGYLWRFADDPLGLRREFRRLKNESDDQWVLHLCGCGLSVMDQDRKVWGCAEKSHLILGGRELNDNHRTFHRTIALAQEDDYTQLCGIIHRASGGTGLF